MINGWDLFDLILFVVIAVFSIYAFARFLRWRTAYNLGIVIISIMLSAIAGIDLIAPGKLTSIEVALLKYIPGGPSVHIGIAIFVRMVFLIFILAFVFYYDIKRFLAGRKAKAK